MTTDMEWMTRAACASRRDLPWLIDAASVSSWDATAMHAICRDCPVQLDCLNAVDALDITGGWWAGRDRDPHAPRPAPAPDLAIAWEPVRTRRAGVVAAQAALTFDGLGAA